MSVILVVSMHFISIDRQIFSLCNWPRSLSLWLLFIKTLIRVCFILILKWCLIHIFVLIVEDSSMWKMASSTLRTHTFGRHLRASMASATANNKTRPKAVIFDMGGVLFETPMTLFKGKSELSNIYFNMDIQSSEKIVTVMRYFLSSLKKIILFHLWV